MSVYDNVENLLFYALETVDEGSLKISFNFDGYSHALVDTRKYYSFWGFTEDLKKTEIIPYDTIPDFHNARNIMNSKIDVYFSYYIRIPIDCRYLMIYTLNRELWDERFSAYSSITIDLTNLDSKRRSIAIRKEKIRFRDFEELDFLDVTSFKFLIKDNKIVTTKPIYNGYGSIIFEKKK